MDSGPLEEASYRIRTFLVPQTLEDDFATALMGWGCLGSQVLPDIPEDPARTKRATANPISPGKPLASDLPRTETISRAVRFEAWFPEATPWTPDVLTPWTKLGVALLDERHEAPRDWLAEYRRQAQPFQVGHFLIDPRDPDQPSSETSAETSAVASFRLSIPARNAFGTGSHETTRLLLHWLQDLDLKDVEILDVGTGSAILAIAALTLGARRVVGFDIDTPSVCAARQNIDLNPSPKRPDLFAGVASALRVRPRFDLALINVLPERIADDLPDLLSTLKPCARVLSSGNLTARRVELLDRWQNLGLSLVEERTEGEWVAFLLRAGEVS